MAASIPRAGVLILTAVGLAQVLVTLDYFALTVALPQMAHDLDVSTTDMQWALTAYLLAFASLMVAGGRIGDIVGRRRTLIVGIVVFGAASLLCGLAYDEYMLVACRVLQGVGAAILFPVSMGVLGNAFDEETRPRAVGAVVLVSTVGTALGPLVGGVLTDALDWRWVFLLNVPFSILAAIMVVLFVRESRDETVSRHVDHRGVVTLSASIVALTLAIDRAPSWADSQPLALAGCLVAFVALMAAFVLLERRVDSPLVDLRTFRSPFVMVTLSGFLSNFLWALSAFVATLWLQEVKDLSPLESGLAFLAMSAGVACAGPLSGRLILRHDLGAVMAVAALVGAAGAVGVSLVDDLPVWLPLFGILGLGVGVNYALVNQGALASVPPEKAGAASGIALTALVIGAAFATVIAATLLEELSGGPAVDQDAVDTVMRIGALAGLAAAVPVGTLWLRRRRGVGEQQPEAA